MHIREYLFRKRISTTAFSKTLKISRAYLSRIVNGKIKPGMRLAKDIEIETEGAVTVEELLGE